MELNKIFQGHCLDVLKTLPDQSVNTVITSPPYWGLRDYGVDEPFFGSGTTGKVAIKHNRNFIGIELNPDYIQIAEKRLSEVQLELINEL